MVAQAGHRGPRSGRAALLVALICVLGAGCNWATFHDLQEQTPVLALGSSSGYPARDDFGSALLPLAPPTDGATAARFLVSAANQTAVALVSLDSGGHPAAVVPTDPALDSLNGFPITAMAEIPGTGQAVLGSPNATGGTLLLLDLATPYTVSALLTSASEPQLGAGVAAGALGGGPAPDLVALSANALHVFVDGKTTGSHLFYTDVGAADGCPISLSYSLPNRIRNPRPVVIAPLLAGGGSQIAVGTPVALGSGSVSIFDVDAAAGTATCALVLRGTSGSDERFGQSLAVGDFDGDGVPDLLVGEPPKTVYLFRGPLTGTVNASAAATATLTDPAGVAFGASLAAVPLDGHPGDEALIGDPDVTVSGATLAGRVSIRTGPMLAGTLMPTAVTSVLTAREPHASDGYGTAVATLPFCGAAGSGCQRATLPLVGTASRVYTYFTLGPADPRAR